MPAVTKERILSEICRLAVENGGKPPGVPAFQRATGIGQGQWLGVHWSKWSDALIEAGFAPNERQQKVPEEEILTALASFIRELGRFPTKMEMRLKRRDDATFPSPEIFYRRYGSLQNSAVALLAHAQEITDTALAEICRDRITNNRPTHATRRTSTVTKGSVYLMKAGKFYKIGLSNSSGRRKYELGIQLPEKPKLIHEIKTDCPIALESYWHNRFASQRKNGEWFELDAADVRTFKSRKQFFFSEFFT